jgi:hypothetical protein
MQDEKWFEHEGSETVALYEVRGGSGPAFVVMDRTENAMPCQHYKIVISVSIERETLSASIAAEHSDDRPGTLAQYAPTYEYSGSDCAPGEVSITDDGLMSALARSQSASHVQIRIGWTALLPTEYIEPVRLAISLAEAVLSSSQEVSKP